ncbi:helix-turn-helix transcriptional regulator [Xanthomonas nasturtii]|uniref:winged helix-turn-helix transcriptional regulator n=1 Tax=Xanthomonas nasturtii TaxID=1843581 RepID=UPI002011BBB1|nr:helix-turn-helix domain-containing protein [Xanthomonas nasturtii]MCL1523041.1 helix-turn-helix transcriptional regulator [Xanthomonas nasturtii]MCL1561182.1 helix-turn-helix transcriptional regulator [Xanthomonas nasturtii]MCL1567898.1 helix-turn-helix transcriptional regulator [Xanthomonas nasturtii]MCL1571724.1 helix-turn-helix transcriptional regulator [Xanthomonas nasturtii]MCL1579145.1 helix-turn-helix transcriptional regulator [Xanthomonas nasturtii]
MAEETAAPCDLYRLADIRTVLEPIANKWSVMIMTVLCNGPMRFNRIKRQLDGVTHKSLTEALRRLQRIGLISREVISSSPVAVQYRRTPLGDTLEAPLIALLHGCQDRANEVIAAEQAFAASPPAAALEPASAVLRRPGSGRYFQSCAIRGVLLDGGVGPATHCPDQSASLLIDPPERRRFTHNGCVASQ